MLSDQGAFYSDAQPTKFKAGLFHVVTGSIRSTPRRTWCARRRVHEQGAGRRCVPLLVPHHRGIVPDRAAGADRGVRARIWTRPRSVQEELHPARAVPVPRRPPDSCTTRATIETATAQGARRRSGTTRTPQRNSSRRAPKAELLRHRASHTFTEAVGAGPSHTTTTSLGLKMFDSAELRVHPTGKAILKLGVQDPGPGPRDHVRPDRGRGARHPAVDRREGHGRRHRQHAVRSRHVRVALDSRRRRRDRDG